MELGNTARDRITGFEGTLTGEARYLTGCTQFSLTPKIGPDGAVRESQWFDEGRLEKTGEGFTPAEVAGPTNGGPQRDAPPAR